MTFTNYYIKIAQGPMSSVRLALNDVPFHRETLRRPHVAPTLTGPAIHLLVPGENELTIEIDRCLGWSEVSVEILADFDRARRAVHVAWPAFAKDLPPQHQRLPAHHRVRFTPEGELFRPAWLDSPPQDFDCAGTDGLRAAVAEVHEALVQRDIDRYAAAYALKMEELRRAYAHFDQVAADISTGPLVELFQRQLAVRPLDLDRLHFERRAGGRVAHVRHADGGHVIEAHAADEPNHHLRADLSLTFRGGAWRVFR